MQLTIADTDHLSEDSMRQLIELTGDPCISIYMPTYRSTADTEQGSIRLKNLANKVESDLIEAGNRKPDARHLLEPIRDLVDEDDFWQHQGHGLAIFRTKDAMLSYRLPVTFDELTVVAPRPHIKPLLPLITNDGRFYLLALSQKQIQLFRATRFMVEEIDLPNTPSSLEEAMQFDEFESQLQFQTGTGRSSNDSRAAIFHGHSDAGDDAVVKENIKRFLHRVDDGVTDRIGSQQTPLVLAGVEYIRGLYREVSQYAAIVEDGVDGNPDNLSARELQEQAWPIVEPMFDQVRESDIERYLHLRGNDDGKAGSEFHEIVSGAYFQRVDTLFVPKDERKWGVFDSEKNRVYVHSEREAEDSDLYDFAAVHTLLNGGRVHVMEQEKMPANTSVAAVFRYETG